MYVIECIKCGCVAIGIPQSKHCICGGKLIIKKLNDIDNKQIVNREVQE